MRAHGFVGNVLIRAGLVDAGGLSRATEVQARLGSTIGRALAELGLADESAVSAAIALAFRLEYLADEPVVSPEVASLLPADFCRKRRAVPLSLENNLLRVAVADPADYSILQDVQFKTGKKTVAMVVTQTSLEELLRRLYAEPGHPMSYDMLEHVRPAGELEASSDGEYELIDPDVLAKNTNLPPVVRLVNLILSDAARAGASDVHVEPHESFVQVRHRVDGLLHDTLTIPRHLQAATISRLKIISGMDIAERRKPQDGRSRLRFEGRRIDLRVSTLPTQYGEKVVIRLLNSTAAILTMDQLGFAPDHLRALLAMLARPQGMILVTGPTGSGKTSTLYAALKSISSSINNIITLEDPIEIQLPSVNQVQVNPRAGVTFASGLRSILRQDPNVILVGEIRDQETADIALSAAQTGHLLLSTLHTNDSPATITRLIDLGVQPFLVASSVIGILAQRLCRRPCSRCAIPKPPSAEVVEKLGGYSRLPSDAQWIGGSGCEECGGSGLKGRIAIHEVLQITDELRELISNRAPEHALRKAARRAGMQSLVDDGIAKAARGLTTLEEVLRVAADCEARELQDDAPAVAVPASPSAGGSQDPPPPVSAEASPTDKVVARRRVLVVEDSPTVSAVVKYFLELEGLEVFVAEDGRLGLEMALREHPDVIVSDVQMPGMGGIEMVKALRADSRVSHVRILMLTSEASIESETEGLEAGADDYICKPVEPRRLAARVKALLSRSRHRAA